MVQRRLARAAAVLAVVAIVLAIAVTACGATVAPGHGSPAAAVVGVVQGLEHGDVGAACTYAEPDQDALCVKGLRAAGIRWTGSLTPTSTVRSGRRAIVAAVGQMCVVAAGQRACGSNHNPRDGLPVTPGRFSADYAKAVDDGGISPSSPEFWVEPMAEVNGRWYLVLGS